MRYSLALLAATLLLLILAGCTLQINLDLTKPLDAVVEVVTPEVKPPQQQAALPVPSSVVTVTTPASHTFTIGRLQAESSPLERRLIAEGIYPVDALEFRTNEFEDVASFHLRGVTGLVPILALARVVTDTAQPPLPFQGEPDNWILMTVKPDADLGRCSPVTDLVLYQTQYAAHVPWMEGGAGIWQSRELPISRVAYLPPGSEVGSFISTVEACREESQGAAIWVYYLLASEPGADATMHNVLYAFYPIQGTPAGDDQHRAYCRAIGCNGGGWYCWSQGC
jgi:hypothetical protein